MLKASPAPTKTRPHRRTHPTTDRLDRIMEENKESVRAKGWVFTGSPAKDPESRKLIAKLILELSKA